MLLVVEEGAWVSLMDTGEVLTKSATCVSPAPMLGGRGWLDNRDEAMKTRKKSRELVASTVRALDERGEFAVADDGEAAELPETFPYFSRTVTRETYDDEADVDFYQIINNAKM